MVSSVMAQLMSLPYLLVLRAARSILTTQALRSATPLGTLDLLLGPLDEVQHQRLYRCAIAQADAAKA